MPPISSANFFGDHDFSYQENLVFSEEVFAAAGSSVNSRADEFDVANLLDRSNSGVYPARPYWNSFKGLEGTRRLDALHSRMMTARAQSGYLNELIEEVLVKMGDLLEPEDELDLTAQMALDECHHELLSYDKELAVWNRELAACEIYVEEELDALDIRNMYMP